MTLVRPGLVAAAACLVVACDNAPAPSARQTGAFREAPVLESSGATPSRTHPGRFWTLNDSGNPASLFLADTTGRVEGFVSVPVTNRDWEAIASGPCGPSWCLYVGDIGDNTAIRRSVSIVLVREPDAADLAAHRAVVVDSIVVRYQGGPRDAETLIVDASGNMGIVTKGQDGHPEAFLIPGGRTPAGPLAPGWAVPISTSLLLGRMITDGALSPDGSTLALRTYRTVYLFTRGPGDDWLPTRPAGSCDTGGAEPQGEGLAWWNSTTLLLTSETLRGRPGPITLLPCAPR